jgi:hypothetical protein
MYAMHDFHNSLEYARADLFAPAPLRSPQAVEGGEGITSTDEAILKWRYIHTETLGPKQ